MWNAAILGYGKGEGQEAGVQSDRIHLGVGLVINSIRANNVSWWPKEPS